MVVAPKIVLPIEPAYVGHREAEERRKQVSEWLRRREQELTSIPRLPSCRTATSGDRSDCKAAARRPPVHRLSSCR